MDALDLTLDGKGSDAGVVGVGVELAMDDLLDPVILAANRRIGDMVLEIVLAVDDERLLALEAP